jgi:predicted nucleic acid-binding protein
VAKEIELPSVYLDSCCFIDVVKHKFGKQLAETTEKHLLRLKEVWMYKKMLQAAIDRKLRVFTSALTTVECTSVEGDASREVQEAFGKLFAAANLITPVQPTHAVRELATALKWRHGINLAPMDSMQVASALVAKAKEFITTDGVDNLKAKTILGNAHLIEPLGLRVTLASGSRELPSDYRMEELFPAAS